VRIFVYEQAFRFSLIFQKHQKQSKAFTGKQETPSAMQSKKIIF
jgi:hypothetical protein